MRGKNQRKRKTQEGVSDFQLTQETSHGEKEESEKWRARKT